MLAFAAQPVPSNDSFFYDGAVVNFLLHGQYCNPSLAQVLPISGTEVFSAYPPLYQFVLLCWMKCFGTSVLAAMWLHVLLLAIFSLAVVRIFQELKVPNLTANVAALFLFGITFNDRPDTLAHALGALALLGLIRRLHWATAVLMVLTLGTSLQIGGIYGLWLALFAFAESRWASARLPFAPVLASLGVLLTLVLVVKFGHPRWWEGFREHVGITPSVTGWRLPRVDDLLKIGRATPGLWMVAGLLLCSTASPKAFRRGMYGAREFRLAAAGILAAFALIGGCLFVLTPNTIHIAGYLQPTIVGAFLAWWPKAELSKRPPAVLVHLGFAIAVALVSIRAMGISTWGVLCSRDMSCSEVQRRLDTELSSVPAGRFVFVSSAYLYEAANHPNVTCLHSDWVLPSTDGDWELDAIDEHRPAKLLLTQFDYYRRYEAVVARFQESHSNVIVRIQNLARTPPPDANPKTRKIVQHISWAPVIIGLEWPQDPNSNETQQQ